MLSASNFGEAKVTKSQYISAISAISAGQKSLIRMSVIIVPQKWQKSQKYLCCQTLIQVLHVVIVFVRIFQDMGRGVCRTFGEGSIRHQGEGLLDVRANVYLTFALMSNKPSKKAKYRLWTTITNVGGKCKENGKWTMAARPAGTLKKQITII